jgi:hypothetical protein
MVAQSMTVLSGLFLPFGEDKIGPVGLSFFRAFYLNRRLDGYIHTLSVYLMTVKYLNKSKLQKPVGYYATIRQV